MKKRKGKSILNECKIWMKTLKFKNVLMFLFTLFIGLNVLCYVTILPALFPPSTSSYNAEQTKKNTQGWEYRRALEDTPVAKNWQDAAKLLPFEAEPLFFFYPYLYKAAEQPTYLYSYERRLAAMGAQRIRVLLFDDFGGVPFQWGDRK